MKTQETRTRIHSTIFVHCFVTYCHCPHLKCHTFLFNFRSKSEEELTSSMPLPPQDERKFIVFESALQFLFQNCKCGERNKNTIKVIGTAVQIDSACSACGCNSTWFSQPKIRQAFAGNLLTAAAVLFSGCLVAKVFKFFDALGIQRFSKTQFFDYQRKYLHSAVHHMWNEEQQQLIQDLRQRGQPLQIAGDGRCDSPGFR